MRIKKFLMIGYVLLATTSAHSGFDHGLIEFERGNYADAARAWWPLAKQGVPDAQFNLAFLYDTGRGVPQNDREAMRWYHKAAKQGNAKAMCNLAFMYANGRGITRNDAIALQWYLKAAKKNNKNAQYYVGLAFAKGRGVQVDYIEAQKWFFLSATNKNTAARLASDILANSMTSAQINVARWLAHFELQRIKINK